ncbi:integrase core domain-containing protein [Saccharomonospora piscinae]|uniref:integrase core domain-containing protein n=1 Tax=Saccharomonospora piscinae TaxID=687388 RepID=UPI0004B55A1F|nr:integrase core domain-containing protein [Saccharomonospora piscinae]
MKSTEVYCPARTLGFGRFGRYAYDNSLAESTIGLFKTEVIGRHGPFKTLAEVEFALVEWVDWYNNAPCTTSARPSTNPPTTLNNHHADQR